MDYGLAALKLLCSQLSHALPLSPSASSSHPLSIYGIRFQRAWLQGVLVRAETHSKSAAAFLDDGTGLAELDLSVAPLDGREWRSGMYVMVVGAIEVRNGDVPNVKVHKIVDLSTYPDREAMWHLELSTRLRGAINCMFPKLGSPPTGISHPHKVVDHLLGSFIRGERRAGYMNGKL